MLLEDDGLADDWEQGVQGDWEGEWGLHEREDSERFEVERNYDTSAFGNRIDHGASNNSDTSGARIVRKQGFFQFRRDLISHFSLAFKEKSVRWPSRNGATVWTPSPTMRVGLSHMEFLYRHINSLIPHLRVLA